MCGRFSLTTDKDKIKEQFQVSRIETLSTSPNIAPTEPGLCIVQTDSGLICKEMKFGFQSRFSQKPSLLLNARLETVAAKSTFRQNLKHRRCLVLMSGFFEWKHQINDPRAKKQPYYFNRNDGLLLAAAGIWEMSASGFPSFVIITTNANEILTPFHDRMPWFLSVEQQQQWLISQLLDEGKLEQLKLKNQETNLTCHPVTPEMNSSKFKGLNAVESITLSED